MVDQAASYCCSSRDTCCPEHGVSPPDDHHTTYLGCRKSRHRQRERCYDYAAADSTASCWTESSNATITTAYTTGESLVATAARDRRDHYGGGYSCRGLHPSCAFDAVRRS